MTIVQHPQVAKLMEAIKVLGQFVESNPKHPITHFVKILTDAIDCQLHEDMASASNLLFENERLRAKLAEANAEATRLREKLRQ